MKEFKGLIFDLDGVIVDTAKYHFLAWKSLADELGIPFTETDNERLKGVSRMASLEIILSLDDRKMSEEEKSACTAKKNDLYVSYINKLTPEAILPGVEKFITEARVAGYKTAIGSASKNTGLILSRLGIGAYFDAVVDGTKVTKAKPDPEVFLKGAEELGLAPSSCIVFEDSVAGIEAATRGGMASVGIGEETILSKADTVIKGFSGVSIEDLVSRL